MLKRIGVLIVIIGGTLAVGTAGFRMVDGYSWFDAFYMAAITMTTVGYAEVVPLTHAGRIFNSAYLVGSVSVLLLVIGLMTHAAVEMQLTNFFGRRRTRKMIDRMTNHYIVCGFGRVGKGAASELRAAGAEVLVVDKRDDVVEYATQCGFAAIKGDSTRDETLREAGVHRARGMVLALASDADNLFAVISAKGLNPDLVVAARAGEEEAERKLKQVGANEVFAPYRMTGVRLAQSLVKPHVHQFIDIATTSLGMEVWIEQLAVSDASDLSGKTLAELNVRRELKVIVLSIRRADGTMIFNPGADAKIEAGDSLIVMGESGPLRNLEARVAGAK